MPVENYTPGDLLIGDYPTVVRTITILSGQVIKRGAVLGRIEASDKYILSLSAAVDGSEVPACIAAVDVDATGADVAKRAYFSAEVDASKLILGTGHTAATVEAAFRETNANLFVRTLA